jgi:uncharacterized protein (TIGR00251 family)
VTPIEPVREGVRLSVRVQPRAAKSEIAGLFGDRIRIRLAAPPVDGAANEALVRFLAEALGIPARSVTIAGGHASRSKTVIAAGVSAAEAAARLGIA